MYGVCLWNLYPKQHTYSTHLYAQPRMILMYRTISRTRTLRLCKTSLMYSFAYIVMDVCVTDASKLPGKVLYKKFLTYSVRVYV